MFAIRTGNFLFQRLRRIGTRWSSNKVVKEKIPIVLNESDIVEKFVRGSGPGGQAVNKTSNCVQLTHLPTGISVSSHESRELSTNRKIARRKLVDQLDLLINGEESKLAKREKKQQKRKAKSRSRSKKKYGVDKDGKKGAEIESEGDDSSSDDDDNYDQDDGSDDKENNTSKLTK